MRNAMPEGLQQIQQAFSAYIRNPKQALLPRGVEKKRMDLYRELFFNNIDGFLSGGFPVLKRLLSEEQWHALVENFYARHVCRTPYFSEITEEFLGYLHSDPPLLASYPPFLLELAHYEWVEMALGISQEHAPAPDTELIAGLGEERLALSPLAWPLAYRYPVQRLSPQYRPNLPPDQPTYLAAFRDSDYEVRFLELSAPAYALLRLMQERPGLNAHQYLQELAGEQATSNAAALYQGLLQTLKHLAELGIIYTYR